MSRTQMRLPPRGAKVELEPTGHSFLLQPIHLCFIWPEGLQVPLTGWNYSQKAIPRTIYGDDGNELAELPAFSWNDYYCKKNGRGL